MQCSRLKVIGAAASFITSTPFITAKIFGKWNQHKMCERCRQCRLNKNLTLKPILTP